MHNHSENFQDFLALSVVVTGFTEFELIGTGQAEFYFSTVTRIVGEPFMTELCQRFHQIQSESQDEAALVTALRTEITSDDKLGPITRSIIKLWYVGTWYQLPYEWREAYGARDEDKTFVVSPVAYTEGLLWPTIGANPSGAKAPGYGSWSSPPRIPEV